MNEPRKSALLGAAIVAGVVLIPAHSHAQWWEQYAGYLARERQSAIAAALAHKQQRVQRPEPEKKSAVPPPASKPHTTVGSASSRPRNTSCRNDSFSCNWPRLADALKDVRKLFGSSPDKAKRSRPSTELANQ